MFNVHVDHTDPATGVRYVEASPGNGYHYGCFVTPLPVDAQGGTVEDHVLVSVFWPGGASAHVLAKEGYLMNYYAIDKLRLFAVSDNHQEPIIDLVRFALDRKGD